MYIWEILSLVYKVYVAYYLIILNAFTLQALVSRNAELVLLALSIMMLDHQMHAVERCGCYNMRRVRRISCVQ